MQRDKVLRWCREHSLFSPGETVYAALSGGADSVAMLHLLLSLRSDLGITVQAAHFNHHLRGAEADRDEAFCRKFCAGLGVPLTCGGGDVAGEAGRTGKSIELAARDLRYGFLRSLGGITATAHTADDNLETVLLNLTRGSALRGLGGIPPKREGIVRPVLCLTRTEIEAYLADRGLSHITDSTNLLDDCLRNRVRHHVIPALTGENPRLGEKTLLLTESLRADESYLQSQADALLEHARRDGGYDAAALAGAPEPIRRRALRRLLEEAGARDLSRAHLAAAERLLTADCPSASADLPGVTIRRRYGLLTAGKDQSGPIRPGGPCGLCGPCGFFGPFDPFLLPLPGSHALSGGRILICAGPFPFDGRKSLCLRLSAPPQVRPRMAGDRLTLSGGTKDVRRWMIDRKLPRAERRGIPVLEDGGRVLAVFGVGVDPEYQPVLGQPCYELQICQETER